MSVPESAATPKVSVVIPLYNKGPHIARALDSVLAQSEQDFEIVVVDDASTDGGAETVKLYADRRIRLIRRGAPGPGGHAARNAGIKASAAPLIAFLDADDNYNPEFLAVILGLARKYEAAGAYGTSFEIVAQGGRRTVSRTPSLRGTAAPDVLVSDYFRDALSGFVICASATAIRRKTFDEVGLFPEGVPLGGDLEMWMRVGARYPIAVSGYVGAVYHKDAVNRVDNGRIQGREYELVSTGLRLLAGGGLDKERERHLREHVSMFQIKTGAQLVLLGRRHQARKILRQSRTRRFLFYKLWWLFWTLLPAPVTFGAQSLKRRVLGVGGDW
jgi:glycosyltransferase involved in cell wall biosynthesis